MNAYNDAFAHGNAWPFVPAAILQGTLHGFEPGHGETMMAACIGLHYSGRFDVGITEPFIQVAGGVIVIGVAPRMASVTRRVQRAADHRHTLDHRPQGPQGGPLLPADANEQTETSDLETGISPRFRLNCFDDDKPTLPPPAAASFQHLGEFGRRAPCISRTVMVLAGLLVAPQGLKHLMG